MDGENSHPSCPDLRLACTGDGDRVQVTKADAFGVRHVLHMKREYLLTIGRRRRAPHTSRGEVRTGSAVLRRTSRRGSVAAVG